MLVPRPQHAILDQIRNDHELLARLGITPQELEALSKCAFLGTLTSKEDMLFILRQIREATSPAIAQASVFPQPVRYAAEEQADPTRDLPQLQKRIMPSISLEPALIDGPVRRRLLKHLGTLLVVVAAAGLSWNGIIALSRWHDGLLTAIATLGSHLPAHEGWTNHLDRFSVLLLWEALVVGGIMAVIYLRSLRAFTRLKVRPGRG